MTSQISWKKTINDGLKCSALNLMLMLSLTACTQKFPHYEPASNEPVAMPAIPSQFRQLPAPQWCLPTCTQAVARTDKNSLEQLMKLAPAE